MDLEVATQQIENDPRTTSNRHPAHLELDDELLADILCIIHPASYHAYRAVAHITDLPSEYSRNTDGAGTTQDDAEEDKENMPVVDKSDDEQIATQEDSDATPIEHSRDIVLRLSHLPKNPLLGFTFGRSPRSDIELRESGDKKWISNRAFRIYVKENGAIMLEDASRNGTWVDGEILRIGQKEAGERYRWTLDQGSVITCVHPLHEFRFMVTIPRREGRVEEMFEQNLNAYFHLLNGLKLDRNPMANPPPPVLFPCAASENSHQTTTSIIGKRKQWNGGNIYHFNKKIGQGAYATVYLITRRDNGDTFAAKEIEKLRIAKDGIHQLKNEVRIMARIRHDHIVQFVEYVDWKDYMYIIMEYIPGSDLNRTINQLSRPLAEEQVREMASQLISALGYLHSSDITHRDIKPDNIMLPSLEPMQAKLTDFGLSKLISDDDPEMRTFCGTLLYCAPEVYREYHEYDPQTGEHRPSRTSRRVPKQPYTSACDLWSLGGAIFFSLCGSPPYPVYDDRTHHLDVLRTIMTKALDLRPLQRENLSEQCIGFVRSMLKRWPEQRPSIEKLQAHPWMTGLPSTQQTTQTTNGEEDDDISDLDPTEYVPVENGCGASRSVLGGKDGKENGGSLEKIDPENLGLSRVRTFEENLSSIKSGKSAAGESFAFMKNGERLFGELGSSAFGSSGVLPRGRLNLVLSPRVERPHDPSTSTQDPTDSYIHPLLRIENRALRLEDLDEQISPSLLSAESDFRHLHVRSASLPNDMTESSGSQSSDSDSPESPGGALNPTQSFVTAPSASLRREREHSDEGAGSPAPKRAKLGNNPDDYVLYHNYWWDPRDRGTWHDDYPVMTLGELKKLEAEAAAQGKKYRPPRTTDTPNYANPADYDVPGPRNPGPFATAPDDSPFQAPRRIIARLAAPEASALPDLKINVTEQFTSWGRGLANTHVYYAGHETRIPKYALKLVLCNPAHPDADALKDPGAAFYISTKGRDGLRINGLALPSHDRTKPRGDARYWARLRTGDLVQVWGAPGALDSIVLRFKCLVGASAPERAPDNPVALVPLEGPERVILDAIAARCEEEVWARAHAEFTELRSLRISARAATEPPSAMTMRKSAAQVQMPGRALNPYHSMPAGSRCVGRRSRGPVERVRRQSGVSARLPDTRAVPPPSIAASATSDDVRRRNGTTPSTGSKRSGEKFAEMGRCVAGGDGLKLRTRSGKGGDDRGGGGGVHNSNGHNNDNGDGNSNIAINSHDNPNVHGNSTGNGKGKGKKTESAGGPSAGLGHTGRAKSKGAISRTPHTRSRLAAREATPAPAPSDGRSSAGSEAWTERL